MRLMSFALTTAQFYNRAKTVTRRVGWQDLRPGELLCGVVKSQGLLKGQSPQRLAIVRVTSVRRETLTKLLRSRAYGRDEMIREGFPGLDPHNFVPMFMDSHGLHDRRVKITRISFDYVPGGRFAVPGFCWRCGCSEYDPCFEADHGCCWWVDPKGRATLGQTTLCSHCYLGLDCGLRDSAISAEMEAV